MNARTLLALAAACLLPLAAAAQYQWIDKDGRKVFSDRPPPSDTPAGKIVRQPKAAGAPVAAEPAASAAVAEVPAAASAPKVSGKDKSLEDKRKQQEAAEAAKKKAEEQRIAQLRDENCIRAKEARASFDSGVRISRTNEKGERYFLDDSQRAAEVARLASIIASDCKK